MKIELKVALAAFQRARFASLAYSPETGGTFRYTLILGFSYNECLENSLLELEISRGEFSGIQLQACDELIASFRASLNGTQKNYTKSHIYGPAMDESGKAIKGLKVNSNDGSFQLFGLIQSKVEIEAAPAKKSVKSSDLTIAKNKLRRTLPVGKFREFAVENIEIAKLNGETIEL
jgi:hypothetical protein